MAKWTILAKRADFEAMAKKYEIDPVIARIIRNRDMIEEQEIETYLHGNIEQMHNPFLLEDMEQAVVFLQTQINEQKHIRVIGDYDVDGIFATYLLKKGLEVCGAHITVAIPHRMVDGYGLNQTLIQRAYEDGVEVIITCDNGVSALEEIQYAKELGIAVVITDHHCTRYEVIDGKKRELLPECVAVINPKRSDDTYPFQDLCGTMVAYKLIEALFMQYKMEWGKVRDEYLELGAFATICDMMPLHGENRIIAKYGIQCIKRSSNIGLRQLMAANEIQAEEVGNYHIGFILGPCFNATGRLETAMKAIELLQSRSIEEAEQLAHELKELNDIRKELTIQGVQQAKDILCNAQCDTQSILVVYLRDCHESIAGIIAGRIKDIYYKPTFILTKGEEGVKGSGRSIAGYSMYDEMVKQEHFFTKYGGHPMAAGLSMREEDIVTFQKAINDSCALSEEDLEKKVLIDLALPIRYLSEEFVTKLEQLEPFGMGNRRPLFGLRQVTLVTYNVYGKNQNVFKATIEDESGDRIQMIYYGEIQELLYYLRQPERTRTQLGVVLKIAYYPSINEYRGRRTVQIVMKEYE